MKCRVGAFVLRKCAISSAAHAPIRAHGEPPPARERFMTTARAVAVWAPRTCPAHHPHSSGLRRGGRPAGSRHGRGVASSIADF